MLNTIQIGLVGLLGLGAAGLVTANASDSDVACGVFTSVEGGMQTIEGRLLSPKAFSGEYSFSLKSAGDGGSSAVNQGGPFAAPANTITLLSRSAINVGAQAEVTFTIQANGKTIDCSRPFTSRT